MMLLLPMLLVISDEAGPELLPGVEAAVNCSISEDEGEYVLWIFLL